MSASTTAPELASVGMFHRELSLPETRECTATTATTVSLSRKVSFLRDAATSVRPAETGKQAPEKRDRDRTEGKWSSLLFGGQN